MHLNVMIEDPAGSTVRHHWNVETGTWIEEPHPQSNSPWPANYGYILDTRNPADDDELDILVLSTDPLQTGQRVEVRAVGVLLRPDGDDKVLGVLLDDPLLGHVTRFQDVPAERVQAIDTWFSEWSQIGQWRDEVAARARIQRAQKVRS
jgi:inorganic pyrophosphatase